MLKRIFNFFFCNHDDELINQYFIESDFERVARTRYVPKDWISIKSTLISDYKCKNCKRVKRLIVY